MKLYTWYVFIAFMMNAVQNGYKNLCFAPCVKPTCGSICTPIISRSDRRIAYFGKSLVLVQNIIVSDLIPDFLQPQHLHFLKYSLSEKVVIFYLALL